MLGSKFFYKLIWMGGGMKCAGQQHLQHTSNSCNHQQEKVCRRLLHISLAKFVIFFSVSLSRALSHPFDSISHLMYCADTEYHTIIRPRCNESAKFINSPVKLIGFGLTLLTFFNSLGGHDPQYLAIPITIPISLNETTTFIGREQ